MPELPEVDAITGVIKKYAVGNRLQEIEVLRGKNYGGNSSTNSYIDSVFRMGKHIVFEMTAHWGPDYIVAHNAMTGYFDWAHEPWTFDYVEGKRASRESDVRVRMHFADGKVLRFHDARLFGSLKKYAPLPIIGPELMVTPHGRVDAPVVSLEHFARGILSSNRPVKQILMDQSFLAGIGNIYANEACHLAGVDPRLAGMSITPAFIPVLLEALRCSVLHSIPTVTYQWLNVYRRATCGTCTGPVIRCEVAKRATFVCERCQS